MCMPRPVPDLGSASTGPRSSALPSSISRYASARCLRELCIFGVQQMKIESIDFFYLSMPEILDIGDGSQDALLVRVAAGGHIGWGECEASPLVSIAALVCPMSHAACKPVAASVLGRELYNTRVIARYAARGEGQ